MHGKQSRAYKRAESKMGRQFASFATLLVFGFTAFSTASAEDVDVSGLDCGAVLESYAVSPKSVPKNVADACQAAMLLAPGAGSPQEKIFADASAQSDS